jgi:hypothetical protein
MRAERIKALKESEELLVRGFPVFVAAFARKPPFSKPAQFTTHSKTVARRTKLGSASAAIHDSTFVKSLYETLQAWGIGSRASRLLDVPEFTARLLKNEDEIAALEPLSLDNAALDIAATTDRVWRLLSSLRLVENKANLVPSTKALHHLLPDLVVPMDRAYTRPFFGWHEPEFQNHQARCFEYAFGAFCRVAKATNPRQYVGDSWNTSLSKVIDNAIVGVFVVGKEFIDSQKSAG